MSLNGSLAISLTIVLAIIEVTQGFTIRNQKLQDLVAEESSQLEVKSDLERLDVVGVSKKDDSEAVVTVQTIVDVIVRTTENTEPKTEVKLTSVDKLPEEKEKGIAITVVAVNNTAALHTGGISFPGWFETTTVPATDRLEQQTDTNTVGIVTTENDAQQKVEFDNLVLAAEVKNVFDQTTLATEQETAATMFTITEDTGYSSAVTTTTEGKELTTGGITETESTIMIDTATEVKTTTPTTTLTPIFKPESETKKYTTIERKRVTNNEEAKNTPTERVDDSINAHTTESRVSLDKAFDLAPDILSLQELNRLFDTTHIIQTQQNVKTTNSSENQIELIQSFTTPITAEKASNTSLEKNPVEMVSIRAGYLDHTKITTATDETTTANISRETNTELDSVAYEVYPPENYGVNTTAISQLTDDALKEELLKESLINDKEVNSIRYRVTADVNTISIETTIPDTTTTEPKVVEDLRVKPISPEKINTNLYTVNPNYKPLKKIEVQPPKSFTRHPDDNSWRNESLSSLGIVFKGKNSSKAFTEVLKNKTEIVMNNLSDQNKTIEIIELRDRLEKIAEKRKSKKKKTDQSGNTEYTDYEENNNFGDLQSSKETPVDIVPLIIPSSVTTPAFLNPPKSTNSTTTTTTTTTETTTKLAPNTASLITNPYTFGITQKPKKVFNIQDYYDAADDDEYVTLPNVDIMKSTIRPRVQWPVTQKLLDNTRPTYHLPERKPTVQYFPPRPKPGPDVNVDEYDEDFKRKVNIYYKDPKITAPVKPVSQRLPENKHNPTESNSRGQNVNYASNENKNYPPNVQHVQYRPVHAKQNGYLTQAPKLTPEGSYENYEGNRGFIIRHYKDLIDAAIKDTDYDRNAYLFTEVPVTGVTASDVGKTTVKSAEYEYDLRKEVLERFVDNFNQNHEQFKVDFPVLFNTSIVHKHGQEAGKVLASSSAMFKRLYSDATATKANGFVFSNKPYDPNCENITVELSPAYELHYYVPDQEENEEKDDQRATIPYGYRV